METHFSLIEGINQIIKNNNYGVHDQHVLAYVIGRAIGELPEEMADRCSIRLLNRGSLVKANNTNGQYISVIIGNSLLFRAPAYFDKGGKREEYDFLLIYPKRMLGHKLFDDVSIDNRNDFDFKRIDCVNIGLMFGEVSNLYKEHWNLYKEACRIAATTGKSSGPETNIRI
ncbi:MAG: hypothetical protein IT317_15050 [Anaerolineales bacterium]|nr:hypothetical protein [Anaerolineales bacterium]